MITSEPVTEAPTRRVLVVDDDRKLSRLLALWLERAGFDCTLAECGDQALWEINRSEPDAIVLDVMIPHPSGTEICRHLRVLGFRGPIVMISARRNPEDAEANARAGADRFLAKPFPLKELETTLRELLDTQDPAA